mmetsp:Transcript_16879/g.43130  ORF Transcript_16879/g.43130 Transcript_16879/m.43130 type:complete len:210 (-) Transcript_16879:16-645(-)
MTSGASREGSAERANRSISQRTALTRMPRDPRSRARPRTTASAAPEATALGMSPPDAPPSRAESGNRLRIAPPASMSGMHNREAIMSELTSLDIRASTESSVPPWIGVCKTACTLGPSSAMAREMPSALVWSVRSAHTAIALTPSFAASAVTLLVEHALPRCWSTSDAPSRARRAAAAAARGWSASVTITSVRAKRPAMSLAAEMCYMR